MTRASRTTTALLAVLIGFAWLTLARPLPAGQGAVVSYAVRAVTALGAAVFMFRRARAATGPVARARALIAASLLPPVIAGVVTAGLRAAGGPAATPWWLNVLTVVFAPIAVVGFLAYPSGDITPGSRARALTDGTVAALGLWFVLGVTVLSGNTSLTGSLFAAADAFVLGVAASVLARAGAGGRRELAGLTVALTVTTLADAAYAVQVVHGVYRPDSWVALLNETGILLIAAAATGPVRLGTPGGRGDQAWATLPIVPAGLATIASVWMMLTGRHLEVREQTIATILVVGLVTREWLQGRDVRSTVKRLRYAATRDELTGLANRAAILAVIADRITAGGSPPAVLLVDLDRFKAVNDVYGHDQGDELLRAVAGRLLRVTGAHATVGRLGGDEFVIVQDADGTQIVTADRIVQVLAEPFALTDGTVEVGGSVGVTATGLLRDADLAMYAAKNTGRGHAVRYDPSMHAQAARVMHIREGLRAALNTDGLRLVYQPLIRLSTGEVAGAEALIRWDHGPDGRPCLPDEFVRVAESTGLVNDLDAWVLERACRDAVAWGVDGPVVSVNLSRLTVGPFLPELICRVLASTGLPAARLSVEVTESAVSSSQVDALAALRAVQALGVAVVLDDFGTGESSLSRLAGLPVTAVKVDRSFVTGSQTDLASSRLLAAIIGVGKALGLPVVAEGIETEDVAVALQDLGCQYGQGWWYGHPVDARDFPAVIAKAAGPGT